jgi:hypothetical protein
MGNAEPTARLAKAQISATAAHQAAIVAPSPITVQQDVKSLSVPAAAVQIRSQRMEIAAPTAKPVLALPMEVAVPPKDTAVPAKVTAWSAANQPSALVPPAASLEPSRPMASADQTARRVRAQHTEIVVRRKTTAAKPLLTAMLAVSQASEPALQDQAKSRPTEPVARMAKPATDLPSAIAVRKSATVARPLLSADLVANLASVSASFLQ